eukprot:1965_1
MANHNNKRRNESASSPSNKANLLNANAQAFIPSPISSKSASNASSCGESACFAKSKLETIPESPSIVSGIVTGTPQALPTQPQFALNPLSLPQFYANQMNDTLALIPAMDQNGLLVMIPPSLATQGSLFTPIMNVAQLQQDSMYKYMEIDTNNADETYQNISDMKREISEKYIDDSISSLPKPCNNKYSSTFLLRTGQILDKCGENDADVLADVPADLHFLLSSTEHCPPFVSPHEAIADMQSLLLMNNYSPMNTRRKHNTYKVPPRKQHLQEKQQQILGSKVVYLVEDGNKSNGGFAQYSLSPTPSRQSTPKPGGNKRYKQSVTGMKFEGRRTKEVHECFKDNPDLFAKDGYESVMKKITYQIPKTSLVDGSKSLDRALSGILNKLTPQKFNHLVALTMQLPFNQSLFASIFHSVIIREKPLVRLYSQFLIEISQRIKRKTAHRVSLVDLVVDLIWETIDDQLVQHERFIGCDSLTLEDYNHWLHRLYGNYVLLTELYCRRAVSFAFEKLHKVMTQLIEMNVEWTWNIVYVVLIFHGVALQKLEPKSLEEYLESIDELVLVNNEKYKHIPLRIKYLLMDVQEHIESTNAKTLHAEHRAVMNPKKLNEIHAEFCKENNMTQHQLRKLLSCSKIESHNSYSHHHHNKHTHTHSHNNHYLQRRFAPQQNEYPWHTPPRFQRMRQQQRMQNKQKKKKQQQQQTQRVVVKGPLYLRNATVPAPPKKCPPPPPGPPGPFGTPKTTTNTTPNVVPAPVPVSKVIVARHHHRKRKKHVQNNHNNNGWSTVKRSNNKTKKSSSNVHVMPKKNVAINHKKPTTHITHKLVEKQKEHPKEKDRVKRVVIDDDDDDDDKKEEIKEEEAQVVVQEEGMTEVTAAM